MFSEETGVGIAGEGRICVWDEGARQGWAVRPRDSGFPELGVAVSGQCRLQPLEEPPSTHLRFPEFQLQRWSLLQAKKPLWLEGPLEPRPGGSLPLWAHTPLFSPGPAPPRGLGAGAGCPTSVGGRLAGRLGSKVDKTGTPLAPTTVLAAARAARTMRVISGTGLVLCGLLLLLLAPRTLGLAPQSRGEGTYVRWGRWKSGP